MRYRDYKNFQPNSYYHIYNRGQNCEKIFLDAQDYKAFLRRLQIALGQITDDKFKIKTLLPNTFYILAYCLMSNHYHFLIRQNTDIPIGTLVTKVTTSYSRYFNTKYKKIGNIFQDTFKAKLIDHNSYLTYLSAYIHNNPNKPHTYPYSSYREYLNPKLANISLPKTILSYFKNIEQYKKFVDRYTLKMHNKIRHLELE